MAYEKLGASKDRDWNITQKYTDWNREIIGLDYETFWE